MRLLPLLMVLMMAASCGKNGGSSNPPSTGSNRAPDGPNTPQMEEECVAADCAVLETDGTSTDLLDSLIDVPAQVTESQITFPVGKVSVVQGDKITCKTEVMTGEVYHFTISGNTMQLQTAGGSYTMTRLNDGAGVKGTWNGKHPGENGMVVRKTLSVVSDTRVILKNHCEK